VKPIMEILELENMKAVANAMVGAIGSFPLPVTVEQRRRTTRRQALHELHGIPRHVRRRTFEGLEWLGQVITKAGTDDVEKVIDAWED